MQSVFQKVLELCGFFHKRAFNLFCDVRFIAGVCSTNHKLNKNTILINASMHALLFFPMVEFRGFFLILIIELKV